MTTIMAYIILCFTSTADLQNAVNNKLNQGYVPEGGIAIGSTYDNDLKYCQAMDKFSN